jgi:hypothetical protein
MDMQNNELRRLLNCALIYRYIYIYIEYKLVLSKTKREITSIYSENLRFLRSFNISD